MDKAPLHLSYETSDYGCYAYDPHVDFTEFLEEARQHARNTNPQFSFSHSEENVKRGSADEKTKKSWKRSLFKWWKSDKESKPTVLPANESHTKNPRKGHVSGPIHGNGRQRGVNAKPWRAASGPLTKLLTPSKKVENEIPYACLDQHNNLHDAKDYGPVYLVT